MASRQAQVVILSEDLQQQVFVRRLLIALGHERRKIVPKTCPAGSQSGEQFVRERFPIELKGYRRKAGLIAIKLIVITDADVLLVDDRRRQLAASLTSAGLPDRATDEAVAILIPRRNVETWIHYLMDRAVDELTSYPKLKDRQSECQPAVDRIVEWHRSGWQIPDDCPDSLRQAVEELKRIL